MFEYQLPYAEANEGSYTDITTNLTLNPLKRYTLTIDLSKNGQGNYPSLTVCGSEFYMPENKLLIHGDTYDNTQILSKYVYENALTPLKIVKGFALCFLSAFIIAFGIPKNNFIRKLTGVILFISLPLILGTRLELLTVDTSFYLPFSMKWNLALMYLLELVILLFSHSFRVSISLSSIILTLIYSINYYVFSFRGTPLRINELNAAQTAMTVLSNYDFTPGTHLAMAWGIAFLYVILGLSIKVNPGILSIKKLVFKYVASITFGLCIIIYSGYMLLYSNFPHAKVAFAP